MTKHARDAHADAHGEVGPDGPGGSLADVAQQRRHPQGAENQPDETAEDAYCQLMRPARTWTIAAAVAATPEVPMFAPAPAAGWDARRRTAGSRMFPRTSPTTPPARATAKHQAQKAVSSSGSTRRGSLPVAVNENHSH
jgi:hypothetical protein